MLAGSTLRAGARSIHVRLTVPVFGDFAGRIANALYVGGASGETTGDVFAATVGPIGVVPGLALYKITPRTSPAAVVVHGHSPLPISLQTLPTPAPQKPTSSIHGVPVGRYPCNYESYLTFRAR